MYICLSFGKKFDNLKQSKKKMNELIISSFVKTRLKKKLETNANLILISHTHNTRISGSLQAYSPNTFVDKRRNNTIQSGNNKIRIIQRNQLDILYNPVDNTDIRV